MSTNSRITPALVQHARVLDVDIASYTLTVATEFSKKPLSNVSFAVPYLHPHNGEGIYFMPEVGSLCWVCEPSDGNMPFVLAWAAAQVEGDFRAHRRDLNPGDIYLGTRDENFLILRRGGVVQIGATGICQRIFMPVNNTIKDFCENYALHSLGGDLEWSIARPEKTTDGKRPASLKVRAREFANDLNPLAELEIGSHDGDSKTILTLAIKASGAEGAETQITLKMDKDGTVTWDVKKDFSCTLQEGDYSLETKKGSIQFKSKTDFEVTTEGKTKVRATGDVDIKSDATAYLEGSSVRISGNTTVGTALYGVVIMSPTLISWLTTHTHNITAIGAPSGPPVPPLMTNACTSQKLKAE